MATIAVHEFITLDGVFEQPSWTFEYGFDPKMGETIGAMTERCSTILLGRRTYEMFAPAWRVRTVEDDPGAPFFNEPRSSSSARNLWARNGRTPPLLAPTIPP